MGLRVPLDKITLVSVITALQVSHRIVLTPNLIS